MTYVPQVWVDNVTPADAAHMNFIEAGLAAAVPMDGVVAGGTRILSSKLAAGDSTPAFILYGNGTEYWGPGGSAPADVVLYRSAPGVLKTDGQFYTGNFIAAAQGLAGQVTLGPAGPGATAGIQFGSAGDTNLYRAGAGLLKTDGQFWAVGDIFGGATVRAAWGQLNRWMADGVNLKWSGDNGATYDTNLYRDAANNGIGTPTLHANRALLTEFGVQAYGGADPTFLLGYTGNRIFQIRNTGKLEWGPGGTDAVDTNLYRSAANTLKTDGGFIAGGNIYSLLASGDSQPQIGFFRNYAGAGLPGVGFGPGGSTSVDTALFRAGANQLKTDATFYVGADIYARVTGGLTQVIIGNIAGYGGIQAGGDTQLIRWGANQWRASGDLLVANLVYSGNNVVANSSAATQVQIGASGGGYAAIQFGSASDTILYRSAAGTLKTDGNLVVNGRVYANNVEAASSQVWVGQWGGSIFGAITFGSDTYLYRLAAGMLKTDGRFDVATRLTVGIDNVSKIWFGSNDDTNFYRAGVGVLKTDGNLYSVGQLVSRIGAATQVSIGDAGGVAGLLFGSAGDVVLYRNSAKLLQTDSAFTSTYDAGANSSPFTFFFNNAGGYRQILVGAPDSGGAGYRALRILN